MDGWVKKNEGQKMTLKLLRKIMITAGERKPQSDKKQ